MNSSQSWTHYFFVIYHLVMPYISVAIWFLIVGIILFGITGLFVAQARSLPLLFGVLLGALAGPIGILIIGIYSSYIKKYPNDSQNISAEFANLFNTSIVEEE